MTRWQYTFLAFLAVLAPISALHFYLDADEKRCFIEELPTDTIVEGALLLLFPILAFQFRIQAIIVHYNGSNKLKDMARMISLEFR
jgi:hypothetical protein